MLFIIFSCESLSCPYCDTSSQSVTQQKDWICFYFLWKHSRNICWCQNDLIYSHGQVKKLATLTRKLSTVWCPHRQLWHWVLAVITAPLRCPSTETAQTGLWAVRCGGGEARLVCVSNKGGDPVFCRNAKYVPPGLPSHPSPAVLVWKLDLMEAWKGPASPPKVGVSFPSSSEQEFISKLYPSCVQRVSLRSHVWGNMSEQFAATIILWNKEFFRCLQLTKLYQGSQVCYFPLSYNSCAAFPHNRKSRWYSL